MESNITPWKEEGYTHDLPRKESNENYFSLSPMPHLPHSRDPQQQRLPLQKTNETIPHNTVNSQPLYYFPHLQKTPNLNPIDNLTLGIQPTYLPEQNTIVPFVFSSPQPHNSPLIGPFNPLGHQPHNLSYVNPQNFSYFPMQGNISLQQIPLYQNKPEHGHHLNNPFLSQATPSFDQFHVYPIQHHQPNNFVNPSLYIMPNNTNNLFLHFPQMPQDGQMYRTIHDPRMTQNVLQYQAHGNPAPNNPNKINDHHNRDPRTEK